MISADLPFVSPSLIDGVVSCYEESRKPALAVMCPLEMFVSRGLKPEYRYALGGREVAPVGLNLIDGRKIGGQFLGEKKLVLEYPELVYNVNAVADVRAAEKYKTHTGGT